TKYPGSGSGAGIVIPAHPGSGSKAGPVKYRAKQDFTGQGPGIQCNGGSMLLITSHLSPFFVFRPWTLPGLSVLGSRLGFMSLPLLHNP
ncbi:hypothetical protein KAV67_06085, partial [Candidatus Bipolaricaulota bacterium]|nr:hypothetical protein [Candidatus Bipolaricaulota bacterium]